MKATLTLFVILACIGCASSGPTPSHLRTSQNTGKPLPPKAPPSRIIQFGKSALSVSREDLSFITWKCRDDTASYNAKTLVEVGYVSLKTGGNGHKIGFVLYDGGDSGDDAQYSRDGLDHRWGWGDNPNRPGSLRFSFIVEPDNTGLYYDFRTSEDGVAKANDVYKCRRVDA